MVARLGIRSSMPCGVSRSAPWRKAAALAVAALSSAILGCAQAPGGGSVKDRPAPAAAAPVLRVLATVSAARLAPALSGTGVPSPRAGTAPLTHLVHPVAGAQRGNDLYIADAGAGRVFRLEVTLDLMAAVPQAPAAPGTRLAVGADFSLYVLDPPRRRVLKLARNGQALAVYADSANLSKPVAFAVDDARGEVWLADGLYHHLVVFHPLGGATGVVALRGDERNRVTSVTAMALAPDAIHIADASCRCVAVAGYDGVVRLTYGHGELAQPGAIAIDHYRRVFVADLFDSSVKVFASGRLLQSIPAAALGLRQVTDLALDESRLVIADGVGARVVLVQIAPPGRGD